MLAIRDFHKARLDIDKNLIDLLIISNLIQFLNKIVSEWVLHQFPNLGQKSIKHILSHLGPNDTIFLDLFIDFLLQSPASALIFWQNIGIFNKISDFIFFRNQTFIESIDVWELVRDTLRVNNALISRNSCIAFSCYIGRGLWTVLAECPFLDIMIALVLWILLVEVRRWPFNLCERILKIRSHFLWFQLLSA